MEPKHAGAGAGGSSSFSSLRSYLHALRQTPRRLSRRAASATTTHEEMSRVRARSGADMSRSLRWPDLVALGLGGMAGAGVFVTTGRAARLYAGPSVVLSYAIAGLAALLSAFCYTEFAVDMPVAGGAFSYIRITFGEFAAFITGANLLMEYVFSNAAVARSLTGYLGSAIGVSSTAERWRIAVDWLPDGFNRIDPLAVAVILLISLCICYSTKESSTLNMVLTATHMGFIVFIIVAGFWRGDWRNFTRPAEPGLHPGGFFPYGAAGVFNGAAMVYLSYIGYDAVSTMAEEVREPATDIPAGVSGSVALVAVLYCLMAASMCKLVPYDAIDAEAAFSAAFAGWGLASNVVGAGASLGIVTSLLVSMLGQARYLCVIGRSNVAPPWLARVHPRTATPVNASATLGVLTAAIAMFTDLEVLLNLVSIGTLFVFYMVANAVVFRRYAAAPAASPAAARRTAAFLSFFSAACIAFTVLWHWLPPASGAARPLLLGGFAVAAAAALQAFAAGVPQARKPEQWGVPAMPWTPAASIAMNVFLLGSMDVPSYARFVGFSAVAVVVYVLYGVHASSDAEENGELLLPEEGGGGGVCHVDDPSSIEAPPFTPTNIKR